jgi:hypothetical protein
MSPAKRRKHNFENPIQYLDVAGIMLLKDFTFLV